MRTALQSGLQVRAAGAARTQDVPPPVGGLNTRDALSAMNPLDAPVMNNWFPRAGEVILRGGSENFATSIGGSSILTLMEYSPAGDDPKLFAANNDGIFDITAGGAIGAPAQVLSLGYFNSVNITNSAGNSFLWGCNGIDTPKFYNGTVWATPAVTGIANPASLVFPLLFKHRIFAIEVDSMNLWYLPLDSIQGEAKQFPLGSIFSGGGSLMSLFSWTLDGGDGSDDLLVIITTEGELAIYQGTDPTSASSWALVGKWRVGKPLFRRCFTQFSGDAVVLTENGVFPLSKLLKSRNVSFASALSNKIQPSFTNIVKEVGLDVPGWQACAYPQFDALIVNFPPSGFLTTPAGQFVMNTITGSWCSFSGWEALCFIVFEGELYFGMPGAEGIVRKAWGTLTSDAGQDIVGTVHTAYNDMGVPQRLKQVQQFRPLLVYNGAVEQEWGISADFTDAVLSSKITRGNSQAGAVWDVSLWDVSFWESSAAVYKLWRGVAHPLGYKLALWLKVATRDSNVRWSGTNYILMSGGML